MSGATKSNTGFALDLARVVLEFFLCIHSLSLPLLLVVEQMYPLGLYSATYTLESSRLKLWTRSILSPSTVIISLSISMRVNGCTGMIHVIVMIVSG